MKTDWNNHRFHYALLIGISIIVFSINNNYLGGSIENPGTLGEELKTPPDSLYQWRLADEPPFKYRLLFKKIVEGTTVLFFGETNNNGFFLVYKSWSLIFLISAVLGFYRFLTYLGFKNKISFLGGLLFLVSPAVLMAFSLPVHTREDFLAYNILLIGIYSIIENRVLLVLLISVIGVLCRETMLLIPFLFLIFSQKTSLFKRAVISSIPIVIFLILRSEVVEKSYDPLAGLKWNIHNLDQVVGFFFITFGILWVPFIIRLFHRRVPNLINGLHLNFLINSAPIAFGLVVVTTFFGGIFNEIRLLFILFPWVIAVNLEYYSSNKEALRVSLRSTFFKIYLLLLTILFSCIGFFLVRNYPLFLEPSRYKIPFVPWIVVTIFELFLATLVFPFLLKIEIAKFFDKDNATLSGYKKT